MSIWRHFPLLPILVLAAGCSSSDDSAWQPNPYGGTEASVESGADAAAPEASTEAAADGSSEPTGDSGHEADASPDVSIDADGGTPDAEDSGNPGPVCGFEHPDASTPGCTVDYNVGDCMDVAACAALGDYTSTPGLCPGPSNIECCTLTPDLSKNPPAPSGYKLMAQADVTAEMTDWAVCILKDGVDYPMYSTATKVFGALAVLAMVQWHPADFQNGVVHRGVTLYEPSN